MRPVYDSLQSKLLGDRIVTLVVKVTIALAVLILLAYALLRRFGFLRVIRYQKGAGLPAMASDEVERVLRASVGKRVRIVFTDGVAQSVDVRWVDDDGFGYCGPEPSAYLRN